MSGLSEFKYLLCTVSLQVGFECSFLSTNKCTSSSECSLAHSFVPLSMSRSRFPVALCSEFGPGHVFMTFQQCSFNVEVRSYHQNSTIKLITDSHRISVVARQRVMWLTTTSGFSRTRKTIITLLRGVLFIGVAFLSPQHP